MQNSLFSGQLNCLFLSNPFCKWWQSLGVIIPEHPLQCAYRDQRDIIEYGCHFPIPLAYERLLPANCIQDQLSVTCCCSYKLACKLSELQGYDIWYVCVAHIRRTLYYRMAGCWNQFWLKWSMRIINLQRRHCCMTSPPDYYPPLQQFMATTGIMLGWLYSIN